MVHGDLGALIAESLLNTFNQRVGWVVKKALNLNIKADKMDETEKKLFAGSQRAEHDFRHWCQGKQKQLKRKWRDFNDSS